MTHTIRIIQYESERVGPIRPYSQPLNCLSEPASVGTVKNREPATETPDILVVVIIAAQRESKWRWRRQTSWWERRREEAPLKACTKGKLLLSTHCSLSLSLSLYVCVCSSLSLCRMPLIDGLCTCPAKGLMPHSFKSCSFSCLGSLLCFGFSLQKGNAKSFLLVLGFLVDKRMNFDYPNFYISLCLFTVL